LEDSQRARVAADMTCLTTRWRAFIGFVGLVILIAVNTPVDVEAEQRSACFAGSDLQGGLTTAYVIAEWFGEYFEIYGNIHSTSLGQTYRFKADGHSGAGRLFVNYEYESGSRYIGVRSLTEANFILDVENYGQLVLNRTPC
jgi:hypothetical protein